LESLVVRTLLIFLWLTAAACASPTLQPVGRWKIFHSDGRPIFVQVSADGRCVSPGENQKGTWKLENGSLTFTWSDGWKDVIQYHQGRLIKLGFGPGVPVSAKAVNQTAAFKLRR
ncbi:unnamed protein product, partial [Phaeothamnion confervicola]